MGGKALKNTPAKRIQKEDYELVKTSAIAAVRACMGDQSKIESIQAYRSKADFGDLDLLVECKSLEEMDLHQLAQSIATGEYALNANVLSFDHKGFQVDLIMTPSEVYDSSKAYFAWNDLGNLMGRIAESGGMKFGWDGLIYRVMDETEKLADIVLTRDHAKAIDFLGYSCERHKKGFDTLEEIYEYAASSTHFEKEFYLLEIGNSKSRARERKRETYTGFLRWMERSAFSEEEKNNPKEDRPSNEEARKAEWMKKMKNTFPEFSGVLQQTLDEKLKLSEFKKNFNGVKIASMTGLRDVALGQFMKSFRMSIEEKTGITFRQWSLMQDEDSISRCLKSHMARSIPAIKMNSNDRSPNFF